jgi:hypothetical protein
MSGFLLLGGSVLFGVIAGVLGYQRQSAVLIMIPLIVSVGILLYFENELATALKPLTDELNKIEKSLPHPSVPRLKKFD